MWLWTSLMWPNNEAMPEQLPKKTSYTFYKAYFRLVIIWTWNDDDPQVHWKTENANILYTYKIIMS